MTFYRIPFGDNDDSLELRKNMDSHHSCLQTRLLKYARTNNHMVLISYYMTFHFVLHCNSITNSKSVNIYLLYLDFFSHQLFNKLIIQIA